MDLNDGQQHTVSAAALSDTTCSWLRFDTTIAHRHLTNDQFERRPDQVDYLAER